MTHGNNQQGEMEKLKGEKVERKQEELMGVKNMAFKQESSNEGMGKAAGEILRTGWPCGRWGGRDGGAFSLGTHDRQPH